MQKTIAYIDGFNLYFGLKSKGWRRYYWLDLVSLIKHLLKDDQQLVAVKYFTARISSKGRDQSKQKRQTAYLEALENLPLLKTFFGHYLSKKVKCHTCGATWETAEEKMTDVNIAMEMLSDAYNDNFDTALVISGDSDLAPPIVKIKSLFSHKKVVVAFPPGRHSAKLKQTAHAYFTIGESKLRKSVFPSEIEKPNGFKLKKPIEWT